MGDSISELLNAAQAVMQSLPMHVDWEQGPQAGHPKLSFIEIRVQICPESETQFSHDLACRYLCSARREIRFSILNVISLFIPKRSRIPPELRSKPFR